MSPSSRSRSGASMVVGRGVKLGGSKVAAAGSGRIQQQQVVDELLSAKPGPPRDRAGRFIKVDSLVEVAGPVHAVPDLVADVDTELQEAAEDEEQISSAGTEVSGSVSSYCGSDCDAVVGGKSVEAGDHDLLPQSGTAVHGEKMSAVDTVVAQKVFDELPNPVLVADGGILGGEPNASVLEKGVGSEIKAPWVNLFKDNRKLGNGIKLHEVVVEGDLVQLDEEDVDEVVGICLVGLFSGKFPGVRAVQSLRERWKVECKHWIHRSGWILFEFQSEEDRLKVLNGGPYFAYGSNLMLKILPPCFRFGSEEMTTVPTWIQLPDLPFDCWTERALSKIVSKVGIPITTDKLTRTCDRISFARVLVEVDVSKDLVTSVQVKPVSYTHLTLPTIYSV